MIGMAVLGLAFVFFVVIAFLAAKGWQIGHLVALCFLFLFTLLFFFLAAQTLQTREKHLKAFTEANSGLETELKKKNEFLTGNLLDAERALQTVDGATQAVKLEVSDRGRVWRNLFIMGGDQNTIALGTRAWTNDGCLRVGQAPGEEELIEPVPDPVVAEEPVDDAEVAGDEAVSPAEGDGNTADAEADAEIAADATEPAAEPSQLAPAVQPPAGQGPAHGIPENAFVYVFKEYPIAMLTAEEQKLYFGEGEDRLSAKDRTGLCRVPLVYVGRFKVAQSGADVVQLQWTTAPELRPRLPQDPRDPATWVIYEQMPTDAPEVMRGKSTEELQAIFSPQRMATLAGVQLNRQVYDSMLFALAQDGQTAQGNLPPEQTSVVVEFLRPTPKEVDLQALPDVDRPFADDGRAQVAEFLQGGPTEFEVGQTAEFDAQSANELIRSGAAKGVQVKFARQLREFNQFMEASELELSRLKDRILVYEHDNGELKKSTELVQSQIDNLRDEQSKLAADQQGFRREMEALTQYAGVLKTRYNSLTRRLSTLVPIGR